MNMDINPKSEILPPKADPCPPAGAAPQAENPKSEILPPKADPPQAENPKQYQITKTQNTKRFDLEDRTLKFAKQVNNYVKKLPKMMTNFEIGRQLIRSAGSVGANYIEANEALSRKDFFMRIKISRKEAKESRYWLHLTEPQAVDENEKNNLINEVTELMKIFGSIVEKSHYF